MRCPECNSFNNKVINNSRFCTAYKETQRRFAIIHKIPPSWVTVRKRKCLDCYNEFITYEYITSEV